MEREIYQCKMKECDDALENAKDTHTPAENFAVGSYWGNRAGVPYNLNFLEDQFHCSNKDIDFSPREVYQVCPQKFRKVENLTYEYWDLKSHVSFPRRKQKKRRRVLWNIWGWEICAMSIHGPWFGGMA